MKTEYQRIPGVGTGLWSFRIGIRHRLYQGADHLLLVQSTGYTEEYRRVFYRDIRYVVIRKSRNYIWNSVICLVLLLLGVIVIFSFPLASSIRGALLGVWCTPLVLILLTNLLRGPTCSCYLATTVQTVLLPTPKRMNKVSRLLEFLQGKTATAPTAHPVI